MFKAFDQVYMAVLHNFWSPCFYIIKLLTPWCCLRVSQILFVYYFCIFRGFCSTKLYLWNSCNPFDHFLTMDLKVKFLTWTVISLVWSLFKDALGRLLLILLKKVMLSHVMLKCYILRIHFYMNYIFSKTRLTIKRQ